MARYCSLWKGNIFPLRSHLNVGFFFFKGFWITKPRRSMRIHGLAQGWGNIWGLVSLRLILYSTRHLGLLPLLPRLSCHSPNPINDLLSSTILPSHQPVLPFLLLHISASVVWSQLKVHARFIFLLNCCITYRGVLWCYWDMIFVWGREVQEVRWHARHQRDVPIESDYLNWRRWILLGNYRLFTE